MIVAIHTNNICIYAALPGPELVRNTNNFGIYAALLGPELVGRHQ